MNSKYNEDFLSINIKSDWCVERNGLLASLFSEYLKVKCWGVLMSNSEQKIKMIMVIQIWQHKQTKKRFVFGID